MTAGGPETVIATYRVQPERVEDFLGLLREHHPTLLRLGLVTEEVPVVYRGLDDDGRPVVFEIFTWIDGRAAETAHHLPEVLRTWEAMDTLVEARGAKPKWEFPHVQRVELPPA